MQLSSSALLGLGVIGLILVAVLGWRLATRRYVKPCPSWLAWLLENPATGDLRAQSLIERLDLQPGMRVLDAGCGPGRLAVPIARSVGPAGHVTAVDIQAGMLKRARARAQAAQVTNIRFIQAGLGTGSLEHDQYDRALLVTVLGEIPAREAALQEIFDALKRGGVLSISEVIYDPHFQSRRLLRRLAAAAGFRERASFGGWSAFTLNFEKP